MNQIASRRLFAQRLIGEPLLSAVDVVGWLGAVQSQDFGAAKWAVAQRTAAATDAELDWLFDRGEILRTHVLRPTWHFVLPQDIRWLLGLTAPRVRLGVAGRFRRLEIDAETVRRSETAWAAALAGGRHRTRSELRKILAGAGISATGLRLLHLILAAELDGLIVSGPRRGKQMTYALLDERVASGAVFERDQALLELTRRFFRSHGPAQVTDFAWWAGLTTAVARTGVAAAGSALRRLSMDGKDYWIDADSESPSPAGSATHLLPNFDEYTVAYHDRSALHGDTAFDPAVFAFGSVLANVVTIDGLVRGAWRRLSAPSGIRMELRPLGRMKPAERQRVEEQVTRYGTFLKRPVQLTWIEPQAA